MLTPTLPQAHPKADTKAGRFYTIPDPLTGTSASYPSVTTILGAIAKPALVGWAAKEERIAVSEAAADLYAELAAKPQLPRPMYQLALEQRLGKAKAHTKALQKAAEIGSAAHGAIEWALKQHLDYPVGPEPVLVEAAQWAVMAFEDFARDVSLTPLAVEQVVYNRDHAYAGTMDILARLNTRALLTVLRRQGAVAPSLAAWLESRPEATAVIDMKTGKSIYPEAFLQSVAYQRALSAMGHGRVDGGLIVRLPKVTTDPGFEVAVVPPATELFPTFLAVKQLWSWTYQNELAYQANRKAAKVA